MALTSFTDAFWGNDPERGFQALFCRMKQAKRVTAKVLHLFQERVSIEQEYAKRLEKLARCFQISDEIGSMKLALNTVANELQTASVAHQCLATNIKAQLVVPTVEFLALQSATRKNHMAIIDDHLKTKFALHNAAAKAQDKYKSKCREVNELMNQKPGKPPKEMEKIQAKLHRTKFYAQQYDVEYLGLVEQHNEVHNKWEEDFTVACRECEKLEEDRFYFLRSKLWTYANIFSALCVSNDESFERIRVSLEQCNFAKDLSELLESCSTGETRPQPLQYTNFHTGSELRPLDALPPLAKPRKSIGLKIKTISEYRPSAENIPSVAPPINETAEISSSSLGKWAIHFLSTLIPKNAPTTINRNGGASSDATLDSSNYEFEDAPRRNSNLGASLPIEVDEYLEYDPFDVPQDCAILFHARVIYSYSAQSFEELSIAKGQVIPVIGQQDDGWWEGVMVDNGRLRRGLFPGNFAEVAEVDV
ncbi:hypothetical protein BJ741DRAFT_599379 [Chytriomyces cf. hyalinus JEL632]|nr:hypothetical protein BJ741DRAFT_599379 [Chytriomyces cf. hyalinus JEL632]